MASAIRFLTMDMVGAANSGHPGMPMGMADVATVLFSRFLKFDASDPTWPDRDRFVLSAGHGSPLLYSLLYLCGYNDIDVEDLKQFRKFSSRTAGHPEIDQLAGVEVTTGPLGQGFANGVGMAVAERILAAEFGDDLVDHYTYVMVGDGCLMEGISQEAISFASHNQLSKLIVLFDDNSVTIDGNTSLSTSENQIDRFNAAGWHTQEIDGHDFEAIEGAIRNARLSPRPSMIACKTVIGKGSTEKQGTAAAHHGAFSASDRANMQQLYNWQELEFIIPKTILDNWRAAGTRGVPQRKSWKRLFADLQPSKAQEFDRRMMGACPENLSSALSALKQTLLGSPPTATRVASLKVLETLQPIMPELIGGSADLGSSTQTHPSTASTFSRENPSGRYIPFGVREHAMAAIMNGAALHGGFVPYGGTFLCFLDYARHSIRLSALMNLPVIYVGTHDSICVGEDGPTHQPVEQVASFRSMPNLNVFRPGDLIEAVECWELALQERRPALLVMSRQALPVVRRDVETNWCKLGGYVFKEASSARQVTLIATGSELSLALGTATILENDGLPTAVVSLPNWRLFDAQRSDYKEFVLGSSETLKVAIEAMSPIGWERYVGRDGIICGIDQFGHSGPASDVYTHFGFTDKAIAQRVQDRLKR